MFADSARRHYYEFTMDVDVDKQLINNPVPISHEEVNILSS